MIGRRPNLHIKQIEIFNDAIKDKSRTYQKEHRRIMIQPYIRQRIQFEPYFSQIHGRIPSTTKNIPKIFIKHEKNSVLIVFIHFSLNCRLCSFNFDISWCPMTQGTMYLLLQPTSIDNKFDQRQNFDMELTDWHHHNFH